MGELPTVKMKPKVHLIFDDGTGHIYYPCGNPVRKPYQRPPTALGEVTCIKCFRWGRHRLESTLKGVVGA